jgi:hypothetical protein
VLYRKAAVVSLGVGLLLAIAVATIDGIILARLFSGLTFCPAPGCWRAAQFARSEPMQVLIAFVLGFAAGRPFHAAIPESAILERKQRCRIP